MTTEHETDIATLEQEARQMRARMNRLRLCKRCGGIMRPGIAMGQTWSAGIPDFPGQDTCITMSPGGPGRVIDCMKCEACGWSQT